MLKTASLDAFWITSWPFAEYVKHQWAGAWVCSAFRNEGPNLSSAMILDAVAATRAYYPETPGMGMVTFVDTTKVKPKRHPGYCYLKAGFMPFGVTAAGLTALWMLPHMMPPPEMAHGATPWKAAA